MTVSSVVFIDSRVSELQDLLDGLAPGVQAFVLDPASDGVQQIADALAANDLTGLSSISIVGHGAAGEIDLGTMVLDDSDLSAHSTALAQIGSSLAPGGDLQLYACDVAAGATGQQFIADLSQFSGGANVAAATHDIGLTSDGENWTLDASTSPSPAPVEAPFTAEAQANFQGTLASTVDGQLWYVTGLGLKPPSLAGHVNSDGTSAVQMQTFRLSVGNPDGTTSDGQGIVDIDADPAAGYYFVVDTNSDSSNHSTNDPTAVSLISYRMSDNTQVDFTKIGDHTDLDLTQALAVDPYSHVIYVAQWGVDLAHSGIVKVSYNPLTGALQDPSAPSGRFEDTASNFVISGTTAGAVAVNDIRYIALDLPKHLLYYTANSNGYSTAPFTTAANGIFVTDLNGNGTAVQLTSSTQFPHGSQSGGPDDSDPSRFAGVDANGYISALAVDDADHKVYFLTHSIHPSSGDPADALWYVSTTGGANQTAIKVTGVTVDFAGENGGLSFDPQTRTLYISNQNQTATSSQPSKATIIIAHLNADGTGVSSTQTISMSTLTGVSGTDPNTGEALPDQFNVPSGTSFFNLPMLTVTGTMTHPIEQSASVTLATSISSSDIDSGYYASATAQITGGTFSSNESSANDDHLTVNLTTSGGKLVIGGVTTNITASYNSASETLTLTGYDTIAHYNSALAAVQYNTTGDNPTNYGNNQTRTITWTVSDGEPNIPAGSQNSGTSTVTINAVNDPPVISTPGAQTLNEDALTAISGIGTQLVTDPDADPASASQKLIVALSVAHGTLVVPTNVSGGVTTSEVVGNGSGTVTLTATQNEIDTTLHAANGLKYQGVANYNGPDTLTITANDQGFNGTGGAQQVSTTVGITVNAVNDPVTAAAPASATLNEDSSVAVTGLSIADVDTVLAPNGVYAVTLSASHGALTLTTLTGLTFTVGDGTADASMTFHGTLADINTALATASYAGAANYNGSDTIALSVTDTFGGVVATGSGAATSDSKSVAVTVNAVNDPVTAAAPATVTVNEDTAVAVTGLSIADVDAVLAPSGVYVVTLSASHGTLTMTTLTGLTFTAGDGTADAAMTFHGTLAAINTALATASYTGAANYNGSDTIAVSVTDTFGGVVATGSGSATSDSKSIGVTVSAVNDPVTASAPASATLNEDSSVAVTGLSIADPDTGLAPNGVYSVTLGASHGVLTLTTLTGLTFDVGDGTADASMTFHGTLSSINTALATASYAGAANYNGSDTIAFSVTDTFGGTVATGSGSATSDSKSVAVTVNAVNDPVTAAAPATETVNEDASVAVTGLSIADVDATLAPNGVYAVTLSASHGTLTMTTLTGLTFTAGDGTADATMTFHGTLAAINTALATASYAGTANYNGSDTIAFSVTDTFGGTVATGTGSATSDSKSVAVTVTAVNDPVTASAPATATLNEDASAAVAGLSIADPDTGLAPNGVYEVTLGASHGTLTLATLTGLTFTAGDGTADASMTFHGTLSSINTALATASYAGDANYNGADTIAFSVTDTFGGTVATGTGSATSESKNVSVTVTAVNDPVAASAPATLAVLPNTPTAVTGLSIADVDATLAPNGVYEVTLGATHGTVTLTTLSGLIFTAGDGTADAAMTFHGTLADIDAALATASYAPDTNFSGPASIAFSVTDTFGGTVATGTGSATSDSKTVVVNVASPVVLDLDANDSSGATGADYNALFTSGPVAVADTDTTLTSPNPITSATLTITGNFQSGGEDVLVFTPTGATGDIAAAAFNTTSGVLSLSTATSASLAQWQAALDAVTYADTSGTPNTSNRTIEIVASDGSSTSNTARTTVYFHSLDLDSTVAGTGYSTTFTEQPGGSGPVGIVNPATGPSGVTITEPTGQHVGSITVTLTNAVSGQDSLAVSGSTSNGSIGTGADQIDYIINDTSGVDCKITVTLTPDTPGGPTLADYEAALQAITFTNTSDTPNTLDRDITVVVTDDEGSPLNSNIAHAIVHMVATNDAPVLTPASPTLTGIDEDQTNSAGQTVASFRGGITDPDSPALGIAINSTSTSNGHWEYSLNNGANWTAFGAVTTAAALLLRDSDLVRFVPDALNGSTDTLTYHAWDQSTGTAGGTGDLTVTGGATAFSTASDTASILVASVNDAPVLTPASPALTAITEDDTSNAGQTVAAIVGSSIADVDSGAVAGIAIGAASASNGHWEYSLNSGGSWTPFGAVTPAAALLLRASDLVRFVPDGQNGSTDTFTYHAWDQSSGTAGGTGDLTVTGGTSAFSTASDTATIAVGDVNDAPVLTPANPTLSPITEDATTNLGQTVAAIVGSSIADVDSGAVQGIAITATADGNGHWEYSFDDSTWTPVGTVSGSSALLLRAGDFVRFVPDAQNGTIASISYLAWDQTSGSAGNKVDPGAGGGSSAFSTASDTATITVSPVNDAPVLTPASPILTTITEDDTGNAGQAVASIVGSSIADVDSGAVQGIAIDSAAAGNGQWEYSLDNGSHWTPFGTPSAAAALLLRASDLVRFMPDGQNGSTDTFTYHAWDQSSGSPGGTGNLIVTGGTSAFSTATDTATIVVSDVNDPPVANPDTGSAGENETKSFDVLANDTDVDIGDSKTLQSPLGIVTVTSLNGAINGIDASSAFAVVGNQIAFTPGALFDPLAAGETASVVVNYTMHDSQNVSSSSTLTLTLNGVNDNPVLANVAPSAVYAPGSPAIDLSPGTLLPPLGITDIDNTTLAGATVKLSNGTFLGDVLAA